MPTVETVLGPVEAGQLGVVLSHEHIFISMGQDAAHYPWRIDWDRTRARAIKELKEAREGGVGTMIDLTTPDLGRDVELVRDLAEASGIHVVAATGIWRDVPRSFAMRHPDGNADIFVHEIEEGIGNTNIKAGAIKVANDMEGVTEEADPVIRGAARACKRTGCPISTHHWAQLEVGRRQIEIFKEEGAPMDRICIGHTADSTDVAYIEDLLNAGVYISMDRYPGAGTLPSWEQRNATVKALVDKGWAHKLMLGHDYAPTFTRVGDPENDSSEPTMYTFLNRVAIPALRNDGVSEEDIHMMTVEVPRKFLTGES